MGGHYLIVSVCAFHSCGHNPSPGPPDIRPDLMGVLRAGRAGQGGVAGITLSTHPGLAYGNQAQNTAQDYDPANQG
jgi:hypothetical protein